MSEKLQPLSDADKAWIFREALMRFIQMKPTHAPREDRSAESKLSASTRAAAWAIDAVKAAEYIWAGEATYRSQAQTGSAPQEVVSDTPY